MEVTKLSFWITVMCCSATLIISGALLTTRPDNNQVEVAKAALSNYREITIGALGAFGGSIMAKEKKKKQHEDHDSSS
ncbi:MAG: hypothetical protein ACK518_00755 [bacterium]|jgi:hypothetical protein